MDNLINNTQYIENLANFFVIFILLIVPFFWYINYLIKVRIVRVGTLQALEKWHQKELENYSQFKENKPATDEDLIE